MAFLLLNDIIADAMHPCKTFFFELWCWCCSVGGNLNIIKSEFTQDEVLLYFVQFSYLFIVKSYILLIILTFVTAPSVQILNNKVLILQRSICSLYWMNYSSYLLLFGLFGLSLSFHLRKYYIKTWKFRKHAGSRQSQLIASGVTPSIFL